MSGTTGDKMELAELIQLVAQMQGISAKVALKWKEKIAAAGITDVDQIKEQLKNRSQWHRLAIPRPFKMAVEEILVDDEPSTSSYVPRVVVEEEDAGEQGQVIQATEKQKKMRMSMMTKNLVDVLQKHDEDLEQKKFDERRAQAFKDPNNTDIHPALIWTEDEMLNTANEIGMATEGPDDNIKPEHEAKAAEEHCSFDAEDLEWMDRVLDLSQAIHAIAVGRFYVCKPDSNKWMYSGLMGGFALVTESNLQMACAHYIRLVDLEGWNPNRSIMMEQELYEGINYQVLSPTLHAFEMNKFLGAINFTDAYEAKKFHEAITYCISKGASDVIDELYEAKEKTFMIVGQNKLGVAQDAEEARTRRKYAAGGISDGLEVRWSKPKPPKELQGILGVPDEEEEVEKTEEQKMAEAEEKIKKMMQEREEGVKLVTEEDGASTSLFKEGKKELSDGIQISWKKNTKRLHQDPTKPKTDEEKMADIANNKAKIKRAKEMRKMAQKAGESSTVASLDAQVRSLEDENSEILRTITPQRGNKRKSRIGGLLGLK